MIATVTMAIASPAMIWRLVLPPTRLPPTMPATAGANCCIWAVVQELSIAARVSEAVLVTTFLFIFVCWVRADVNAGSGEASVDYFPLAIIWAILQRKWARQ